MYVNKLTVCILLLLLAQGWYGHAQPGTSQQRARFEMLIDSANYYELRSPERTIEIANDILKEVPEQGNEKYHVAALLITANSKKMLSSRKEALAYVDRAMAWSNKLKDGELIVRSNFMKATIFGQDDQQDSALYYYQEVIRVFPENVDTFYLSGAHTAIGLIYRTIGNFEKAEEYMIKAYTMSRQDGNYDRIFALTSIISLYLNADNPKYLLYFDTLSQTNFFKQGGPEFQMAHFDSVLELKDIEDEEREKRLREVYAYAREHSSLANQVGFGKNLYKQLSNTGKFNEAKKLLLELHGKAKESGNAFKLAEITQHLYENATDLKNLPEALDYLEQYSALRDSLLSSESTQQIAELNIKFESVQKDNEIAQQKAKLDQEARNRRFYLIIMMMLLALAVTIFIYFRNRARTLKQIAQKESIIHQQETERLVKEREIAELTASLESQEKERNRIARDLHDGLGSMMSGISAQIEYLKAQAGVSGNGHQHLVQLKDLVNDATSELRRTSYELMPAKLLRQGLEPAIRDLCLNLLVKNGIEITLEINMDMTTLDPDRQLSLYRIIQELLNNIVKHAKASSVLLQFTQVEDEVCMVVEDDGIGFDPAEKQQNGGLGLGSLQNRINLLNGFLDIASSPGVGTTVTINFKSLV